MTTEAKMFERFVYEGIDDFIHGGGSNVTHIYIPSVNIMFNNAQNHFNAFESTEIPGDAKNIRDIQISIELAANLKRYVELRELLEEPVSVLLPSKKKK